MTHPLDAERVPAIPQHDFDDAWPSSHGRGGESRPVMFQETTPQQAFKSFWIAGFEGGDLVNCHGRPLAMNALTQHQIQAAADYRRVAQFDMHTVRESVGWRLSEHNGRFDYTHLETRARACAAGGVQVIWTLMHYGWPQDIDLLGDEFVPRFARYAAATARYLARFSKAAPVFIPIHEISYLAWALSETDLMQSSSQLRGRCDEIKRQLVRAALAACVAIRAVDPRARFIHTDPLVHIAAPSDDTALVQAAADQRALQFETWDMLSGRAAPELGGAPHYLDMVGLNYFPGNQWELATGAPLSWHLRDPRRADLSDLLAEVHERYHRPLVIAETGHAGIGRGAWVREVAGEVRAALRRGIPIEGVCLYAVVDRPDWSNPSQWHCAGLWDLQANPDGTLERKLNTAYAGDLRQAQQSVEEQRRSLAALQSVASAPRQHAVPAAPPAKSQRSNPSRTRTQHALIPPA